MYSIHLWDFFAKAPPPLRVQVMPAASVVPVESLESVEQDPTIFISLGVYGNHTWLRGVWGEARVAGVPLVGKRCKGKLLWRR